LVQRQAATVSLDTELASLKADYDLLVQAGQEKDAELVRLSENLLSSSQTIQSYQSKVTEMATEESRQLSDELRAVKDELVSQQTIASDLTQEMVELEQQLAKALQSVHLFNELKHQVEAILSVLEVTDLAQAVDECSRLRTAVGDVAKTQELLEHSNATLAEQTCSINSIKADFESRVELLESELSQAADLISTLKGEIDNDSTAIQQSEMKYNELKVTHEELLEQLSEYDELISTLQNEVQSKEEQLMVVEVSNATHLSSQSQLIEMENKLMSSQTIVSGLNQQIQESSRELSVSLEQLQSSREEVEEIKRVCQKDIAKLESIIGERDAEISRLMHANNDFSERVQTAEFAAKKLIEVENSTSDISEALTKKMKQLTSQIDLLQGDRDSLTCRLAESESAREKLVMSLERTSVSHENECNSLKDQILQMQAQMTSLGSKASSLQSVERCLEHAEAANRDLKTQSMAADSRIRCLEDELADLKEISSTLSLDERRQLEELDLQRTEALNLYTSAQAELTSSQNRLKRMKEEMAEVVQELERITIELAETKDENMIISERLVELNAENESLNSGQSSETERLLEHIEVLQRNLENTINQASADKAASEEREKELESLVESQQEEIMAKASTGGSGSNSASDYEDLIAELNSLMEKKMESDALVSSLTNEIKVMKLQLSEYDKKSAKEIALVMQAAQTEMDIMKVKYESEKSSGYKKLLDLTNENESLKTESASMLNRVTHLTTELASTQKVSQADQQELVEIQNELVELRAEVEEKTVANLEIKKTLNQLENKHHKLQAETRELLQTKDDRIAHLERSKLTQDQMEKIKQIKEDRNKKSEECKVYKRQLSDLKTAYEQLRDSASAATATAQSSSSRRSAAATADSNTTAAELLSTKQRVTEITHQYEQAQSMIATLKGKLRECSVQLQEYERERQAVLDVLKACGIDITGLSLNESVDDSALVEQELSEAVNSLAQKWRQAVSSLNSAKENLDKSQTTQTSQAAEIETLNVQKAATERRYQSTKTALSAMTEKCEVLATHLETEKEKTKEVEKKVEECNARLAGNKSAISMEIQVLEEENIDLLRENKELRNTIVTYRTKLDSLGENSSTAPTAATASMPSAPATSSASTTAPQKRSTVESHSDSGTSTTAKRSRPDTVGVVATLNNENSAPSLPTTTAAAPSMMKSGGVEGNKSQQEHTRRFGDILTDNTASTATVSTAIPSQVAKEDSVTTASAAVQGRRRVRTKVASQVRQEGGVAAAPSSEEQPAECTQS
jgi:chromosome segregation ATPase